MKPVFLTRAKAEVPGCLHLVTVWTRKEAKHARGRQEFEHCAQCGEFLACNFIPEKETHGARTE